MRECLLAGVGRPSGDVLDHLDELVDGIALPASELDELANPLHHSATLGRPGNRNSATAPARTVPDNRLLLDREEVEALVEALIEEARRETRRRHQRYCALAALVAFVGVVVLVLLDGGAASRTAPAAVPARSSVPAGVGSSQIAFMRDPDGDGQFVGDTQLWVMNTDGSGQRQLTPAARFGSWSPDGRMIAFSSVRGGNRDIYVMRSDGSHERRLTRSAADEWSAALWSPSGQKLAFARNSDVYVMNADGSGEHKLTSGPARDLAPSWSPDGRKLLFRRDHGGLRSLELAQLYVMNADGSGLRALTPEWDLHGAGSWSPDGRKIVFSRSRDGNSDVYAMNADGTGVRRLTSGSGMDYIPVWSPDGRRIAFLGGPFGEREVWVMNANGSVKRKLTRREAGPDIPVSWSPDSRTIAYSRWELGDLRGECRRTGASKPDTEAGGRHRTELVGSAGELVRPDAPTSELRGSALMTI